LFAPITACWVCDGTELVPYHTLRFELDAFLSQDQDRELAGYTGQTLDLVRCARCGFGQPAALPTLVRYFDRMYDQRWDEAWVVHEFEADYKDLIFHSILRELERRVRSKGRRLLETAAAERPAELRRTVERPTSEEAGPCRMSRQAHGGAPLPPRRRYYHRCSCGRLIPEGVMRCSARTCPEFAPIWARDTRRRLFVNLEQLKLSVMFSVTAPGADLYPFDPRFCSHSPSKGCSGVIG
jgi:hypothetical protein